MELADKEIELKNLNRYLLRQQRLINHALDRALPRQNRPPTTLHRAMRYSLFAGGKRLRPVFCLAACEAVGGKICRTLPPACAVEMIHTYSLIHDDLPCMDNDDFRRGKPTCHKVFGEGMAVLAGDAILTQAFEVLGKTKPTSRYTSADFLTELADAAGSLNLIAGQVADLESEGKGISAAQLRWIHERKTAALISTSIRLGAMSGNATSVQLHALTRFGHAVGLAFQIIDDILDATQTTKQLGKTAGKDAKAQKATYPKILGLERAQQEAARWTSVAFTALKGFGKEAEPLREIARYLLERKS